MQTFKDINELVKIYKLDNIVQLLSPKEEPVFEVSNEHLRPVLREFQALVGEFSKREDHLSTEGGTLDWLNLIYQLLEVESTIIRIAGETNYPDYAEKTRWFIEFAVDSMISIIQRVQKWVKEQAGLVRKMKREDESLRPSVAFALSNLEFSLFCIVLTIMKVESAESKPEELYRAVGEALSRTKNIG